VVDCIYRPLHLPLVREEGDEEELPTDLLEVAHRIWWLGGGFANFSLIKAAGDAAPL
jgi:hypothetical protein